MQLAWTYSWTISACKRRNTFWKMDCLRSIVMVCNCFSNRCPSGTDGKQCETAPERCIGNPCMHNGRCQDFGSGLNCTCPDDYTGIGCQYEYDACQAGACKNGATCIDEGPGFTCICPSGYTGDWFNNFAEIFLTRIGVIMGLFRKNMRGGYNRLQRELLSTFSYVYRSHW